MPTEHKGNCNGVHTTREARIIFINSIRDALLGLLEKNIQETEHLLGNIAMLSGVSEILVCRLVTSNLEAETDDELIALLSVASKVKALLEKREGAHKKLTQIWEKITSVFFNSIRFAASAARLLF